MASLFAASQSIYAMETIPRVRGDNSRLHCPDVTERTSSVKMIGWCNYIRIFFSFDPRNVVEVWEEKGGQSLCVNSLAVQKVASSIFMAQ